MSHNWQVYGHDWAVEHLRKSMRHERVRHAYLFTGPDSVGKRTLALAFAQALNCTHPDENLRPCGECRSCRLFHSGNHPDLIFAEHDSTTDALKIEAIRTVTRALSIRPYEGRYRVAIFEDFDQAQPRAQDALLKTLEEPPQAAIMLLTAKSTGALLPTITSRSQVLTLSGVPHELLRDTLQTRFNAPANQASLLASLSGGRIGWAIHALQDESVLQERHDYLDLLEDALDSGRSRRFAIAQDIGRDKLSLQFILELWQSYWRDVLLLCEGRQPILSNSDREMRLQKLALELNTKDALRALKATRQLLSNLQYNLNLRLAIETMFLEYPGLVHDDL